MKVTIIADDGAVYVGGRSFFGLDLSFLDPAIHAVQWKDDKGWIEYRDNDDGTKPANQPIEDFTPLYAAIDAWNAAKAAQEAAQNAPIEAAANQPSSEGTQPL